MGRDPHLLRERPPRTLRAAVPHSQLVTQFLDPAAAHNVVAAEEVLDVEPRGSVRDVRQADVLAAVGKDNLCRGEKRKSSVRSGRAVAPTLHLFFSSWDGVGRQGCFTRNRYYIWFR